MLRNTAGQTWTVFAFDEDGPVDGDAANITAVLRRDGVEAPLEALHPTPLAGRAGFYDFELTVEEADFHEARLVPVSSTPGVEVYGVPQLQTTQSNSAINVLPTQSNALTRTETDRPLMLYYREGITNSVAINDDSIELSDRTLKLIFQPSWKPNEKIVVGNTDISRTGNTFSFVAPEAVSFRTGLYSWALRDMADNAVLASGELLNSPAPFDE
jgi:hypothetical protein